MRPPPATDPAPSAQAPPGLVRWSACFFLLHAAIALFYWKIRGLNFATTTGGSISPIAAWDSYWQHIPFDLLRDRPWESLWHLHSQPPLYNLLAALSVGLFGEGYIGFLQVVNILLGSLVAAAMPVIAFAATGSMAWAMGLGVLTALNPGLILGEFSLLYDLHTLFFVVAAIWGLAWAQREPERLWPLGVFVGSVAALTLLRSLFHLALLAGAVGLAAGLAGRRRRDALALAVALCVLPAGWYAKNAAMFGFFGASSWSGINLWNVVKEGYTVEELRQLADEGVIDPFVVATAPDGTPRGFRRPSEFAAAGFAAPSGVPLLGRDDLHGLATVALGREFGKNARRLLLRSPGRYLRTVAQCYALYCLPSTHLLVYTQTDPLIRAHDTVAKNVFLLRDPVFAVEERFGRDYYLYPLFGSILFVLLPLLLAAYAAGCVRRCGLRRRDWLALLRGEPVLFASACLIAYVTAAGCLLEFGENFRFRFVVSPLIPVLAARLVASIRTRSNRAPP